MEEVQHIFYDTALRVLCLRHGLPAVSFLLHLRHYLTHFHLQQQTQANKKYVNNPRQISHHPGLCTVQLVNSS